MIYYSFSSSYVKYDEQVSIIVEADPEVLCDERVQLAVEGRFCDSAISVREAALELVGRHIASHPDVGLKVSFVQNPHSYSCLLDALRIVFALLIVQNWWFCSILRRLPKESKILELVSGNEPSKLFEICALRTETFLNLRVLVLRLFLVLLMMNRVFR